jgi:hypothetical protein
MVLAGCAGHTPRDPDLSLPPGVEEAPKGLKFSVKITPPRFRIGQRVVLEATLFNDSNKKFEQEFPTSCTWDYEIASETRVLGPSRECTPIGEELVLEPGELRMIVREWSGNDRYFGAHEALVPGKYKVTAGLIDVHMRVSPMADPVEIEILAQ